VAFLVPTEALLREAEQQVIPDGYDPVAFLRAN